MGAGARDRAGLERLLRDLRPAPTRRWAAELSNWGHSSVAPGLARTDHNLCDTNRGGKSQADLRPQTGSESGSLDLRDKKGYFRFVACAFGPIIRFAFSEVPEGGEVRGAPHFFVVNANRLRIKR